MEEAFQKRLKGFFTSVSHRLRFLQTFLKLLPCLLLHLPYQLGLPIFIENQVISKGGEYLSMNECLTHAITSQCLSRIRTHTCLHSVEMKKGKSQQESKGSVKQDSSAEVTAHIHGGFHNCALTPIIISSFLFIKVIILLSILE